MNDAPDGVGHFGRLQIAQLGGICLEALQVLLRALGTNCETHCTNRRSNLYLVTRRKKRRATLQFVMLRRHLCFKGRLVFQKHACKFPDFAV
jgi:hypothetical protein